MLAGVSHRTLLVPPQAAKHAIVGDGDGEWENASVLSAEYAMLNRIYNQGRTIRAVLKRVVSGYQEEMAIDGGGG